MATSDITPIENIISSISYDNFVKIFTDLLSTPQRIEKTIVGSFEINLESLYKLNNFINLSIINRDSAKLTSFKIQFSYSDGKTWTTNSIDQLHTITGSMNDSTAVCTAVNISWVYWLVFDNTKTPEKQTIGINFTTPTPPDYFFEEYDLDDHIYFYSRKGRIEIEIMHSNWAWANPLLQVITTHLQTYSNPESQIWKFIRRKQRYLNYLLSFIFYTLYVFVLFFSSVKLKDYLFQTTTNNVSSIYNITTSGHWSIFIISTLVFSITTYILHNVASHNLKKLLSFSKKSYILVSAGSEKAKKEFQENQTRGFRNQMVFFFFNIIINMVASYIYSIISFYR
jgi:hypothetical protein